MPSHREGAKGRARRRGARACASGAALLAFAALFASGCVSVAEHRKLERQVIDLQRRAQAGAAARERIANVSAEMDGLRSELRKLQGQIEVAEKTASDALEQARKAREQAVSPSAGPSAVAPVAGEKPVASATPRPKPTPVEEKPRAPEPESAEVAAYRESYALWRGGEYGECIDRFRIFLQNHPASAYADDAGFWMADCHFKQGDYKNAVLRFDDVVRNYPTGNKAPDALYRQGESLLKLGPEFHEAARRAFERVLKEYPDSARAAEARRQLQVRGAG